MLERELGANAMSIGCIRILLDSGATIQSFESLQKVLAFFSGIRRVFGGVLPWSDDESATRLEDCGPLVSPLMLGLLE